MQKADFTKVVASGNDFILIDNRLSSIVHRPSSIVKMCDRKYGIGADGLLVLEKSKIADIRMRIFNADGSEADMCGNGARCAALFTIHCSCLAGRQALSTKKEIKIATKAGIIQAEVSGNNVRIKLTDPKDIKLGIPIKVNNRTLKVNFINTGVPHAVVFVDGLDKISVAGIGREIRYHKAFSPAGANVNFVEITGPGSIKARTYERGVEDETLACGTGSVASALLSTIHYSLSTEQVNVHTQGGEILKVYFDRVNNGFKNVWLEGKAGIVFTGGCYV